MRFFSLAAPIFLSAFAAASPVLVSKDTDVAVAAPINADVATPVVANIDLVATLNELQGSIAEQGSAISANPADEDIVTGALQTISELLQDVVDLLAANGADVDPASLDNGGLLGGLLGGSGGGLLGGLLGGSTGGSTGGSSGGLLGGLLGKRQQDLDTVGTALQGVLTTVQGIVAGLPLATLSIPLVGQLVASLTPLLLSLVAGLNSLVPGLINLVRTLLVTVSNLLLEL